MKVAHSNIVTLECLSGGWIRSNVGCVKCGVSYPESGDYSGEPEAGSEKDHPRERPHHALLFHAGSKRRAHERLKKRKGG